MFAFMGLVNINKTMKSCQAFTVTLVWSMVHLADRYACDS